MDSDLYRAAVSGDVEALQQWLRPSVDILDKVSRAGNTVLHIAAFYGSTRFIEKLLPPNDLEKGRRLLAMQNVHGNTALHEAASGGQAEVVRILLQHSPDLAFVVNRAGETALFKAALAGHTGIIDIFEISLNPAPVEMYTRESDGQTSLHTAVFNKQMGIVQKLVHRRELISAEDHFKRTPLHVAALIPPLEELVPPFHPWLYSKHIKENEYIAELLLKEEESLCDKMDIKNQNPLHIAVKEGNEKVMKLILRYGGDCVEQVDDEGRNILHVAVINAELIYARNSDRMITMLKTLVTATKRLINNCDNHGKTALDIAIESMHKDEALFFGVKKLLEKHGAVRNAKVVTEATEATETQIPQTATSKSKWKTDIISLNAVLIGAIAFQAPFMLLQQSNPLDDLKGATQPESKKVTQLECKNATQHDYKRITQAEYNLYTILFYAFFLSDTVALCTCVASTILLLFALFGGKEDKRMVQTCFMKVMVSLLAILLAYGCAVALVLGPKYLWLSVTIWFLLFITPLAIRVNTFHSKLYIFTETRVFIWFIVEDGIGLIISLIVHVFDIFYTLCCMSLNLPRGPCLQR